ncbi:hypothetical protein [Herbaspirillum lusitanum]|uniref:hypothetical protein n=1 Tax=Herbaspirillum lusitanum TaxID=213312 RepID=UPI0002DF20BF|nr:hypothetical protein [Herbaspirillum lusitanum]
MNIDTSHPVADNLFLKYGLVTFTFSGLFVSIFGAALVGQWEQKSVFLLASAINIYFALAIWAGVKRFHNFGIAILLAIVPCVLSLLFKFQYLIPALSILYLYFLIRSFSHSGNFPKVAFIGLPLVAVGYALIILGTPQATDIFFPSKMLVGQFSTDSFFHMAIASMIEQFGQVSIGAHGLVPIKYYTLSHYFFASIAYLGGVPVLASYSAMYSIVLIPLLFLSISAVAEGISDSRSIGEYIVRQFFIGLIFSGFLGYGPSDLFARYAMWTSFFSSESYTLSIILLCAMLSLLNIKRFGVHLIAVCACIALMCQAKASTAVIAYGLYAAHLLFFSSFKYKQRLIVFAVFTLVILVCFKSITPQTSEMLKIDYFDFVKNYVHVQDPGMLKDVSLGDFGFWGLLLKFSGVFFFFSWICLVLVGNATFFSQGTQLLNAKALVYNGVALCGAFVAVVFMVLPGGAVYYFANVSMFVALPFILIYMGASFRVAGHKHKLLSISAIIPLLVVCIGVHQLKPQALAFYDLARHKSERLPVTDENARFADYLHQLESVRQADETKKMLVYIAKDNVNFWDAPTTTPCFSKTFAMVAVSERPALFGLQDKSRCEVFFYGFNSYPDELYKLSSRQKISEKELLGEAKRLGFDGYVEVTQTGWNAHRAK